MAEGWASGVADQILDAAFNNQSFAIAAVWAKLHVGAPGAAGTANAATETTREQVSMGSPSGGAISNDTAVTWTDVAAQETYTHVSLWTDETAGSFVASGTITANEVDAGDDFTLPVGDIDASIPVAS